MTFGASRVEVAGASGGGICGKMKGQGHGD
jgi:hypothetical protein